MQFSDLNWRILILVLACSGMGGIYAQTTEIVSETIAGAEAWELVIYSEDPLIRYAATGRGLLRSTDGGQSWTLRNTAWYWDVAIDPHNPNTLYSFGAGGVIKTTDGGIHWVRVLEQGDLWHIRVDPQYSDLVYVVSGWGDGYPNPGLYRSSDGGTTWQRIFKGSAYDVAIHPRDPNTIYVAAYGEVYRTTDGGMTWQGAYGRSEVCTEFNQNRCNGSWEWASVVSVAIDAQNPNTIYAANLAKGAMKSTDRGETWTVTGLPAQPSSIKVDPRNSNTVYLRLGGIGPQLLKSTDGAETWTEIQNLSGVGVGVLTMDPQDTNVLYIGSPSGIWKSLDGGVNWIKNPILRLDATIKYVLVAPWRQFACVGTPWMLSVKHAPRNSSVRLSGTSNGESWVVQEWARTDANGQYVERGEFPLSTGSHSLTVNIAGTVSNQILLELINCSSR